MRNVWAVPDLGSAVERLAFPTTRERFDYLGFHSTDEEPLKWCRDLYSYYWERAKPKTEYVLVKDE